MLLSIIKRHAGMLKLALLLFPVMFVVTACQHAGDVRKTDMAIASLKGQQEPQMAAVAGNVLVLTWKDGVLGAQNALSGELTALGPVEPGAKVDAPRLLGKGDSVVAIWLETVIGEDNERRYTTWVRVSENAGGLFSEPVALGEAGHYVSAAEVVAGPDGQPWVATLESAKEQTGGAALRLYRWRDGALQASTLLEGAREEGWREIRVVADERHAWLAWVAQNDQKQPSVRWLELDAGGQVIQQPRTAMSAPYFTGMKFLRNDARLMVFWMDNGNQINGRALSNGTADWVEIEGLPKRLDGMLSGYSVNVAPDGAVHLLYAQRFEQGDRDAVFYRLSPDGLVFGEAQRINTGMPAYLSTATTPEIAFDASGKEVLISYLDFRLMRSTLFGNYSHDGGRTWLDVDVPLNPDPSQRVAMYASLASLGGTKFVAAWTESPDSSLKERYTAVRVIDTADFAQQTAVPVADPGKLKGRVEKYWRARVKGDHAATYWLYDPFYQRMTTVDGHKEMRGRFKVIIHDFEVGDITEITPYRYRVKIRYEHELKELAMPGPGGKKMSIPREWVDTQQEWIWIDGNWHVVYVDIMKKPIVMY